MHVYTQELTRTRCMRALSVSVMIHFLVRLQALHVETYCVIRIINEGLKI